MCEGKIEINISRSYSCYPVPDRSELKNKSTTSTSTNRYIKNDFEVDFIITELFYFSTNIRQVENAHYMSEESNIIVESCPSP